jgi:hypothetical protein
MVGDGLSGSKVASGVGVAEGGTGEPGIESVGEDKGFEVGTAAAVLEGLGVMEIVLTGLGNFASTGVGVYVAAGAAPAIADRHALRNKAKIPNARPGSLP